MKIIFHGGAGEVGRSCVEVVTTNQRILLDCGLKITPDGTEYPTEIKDPAGIDAVFISHAHLDHTGALPWMENQGMKCPIYCTKGTKALTRILLADAFKIGKLQHHKLGYKNNDIKEALGFMQNVKVKKEGMHGDIKFEFYNAGHIPGSAYIVIETEGKRLIYTGDINVTDTEMHKGAIIDVKDVDVLLTESTYGDREHPNREGEEKRLIAEIEDAISRGGSAIVPVFAVGRAQEILMILAKNNLRVPIYFEGMGKRVTETVLRIGEDIRDAKGLSRAFNRVKAIGRKERPAAIAKGGVYVTTSGMLTGGPVIDYLKAYHDDPDTSIILTGYQGENTNGRLLLEQGEVYLDGQLARVKCKVVKLDFSAHAGQSGLKKIVRDVGAKKVFFMHGDTPSCEALAEWARALDYEAIVPKLGETHTI